MPSRRIRPTNNALLITALTAGAGIVAGLAAAAGSGPFALAPHQAMHLVRSALPGSPLNAGSLFAPPVQRIVHRTIDVYDVPRTTAPAPPGMAPEPARETSTPPSVYSSPTPTGQGDDDGGGDD